MKKNSILIIAMSESVHTCRWIEQFNNVGWSVHLFPSTRNSLVHPDIKCAKFHHPLYVYIGGKNIPIFGKYTNKFNKGLELFNALVIEKIWPNWRPLSLAWMIKRIKPNLIHSLELQTSGYLTLDANRFFSDNFPNWLVTNWGSDIYLFGRMNDHRDKIKSVLDKCDFYSCECQRDIELAKKYGFKGRCMEVFPNAGGFELDILEPIRNKIRPSKRKIIMLKGYQGWAGRALFALRAIEQCVDIMKGYEVAVYSADASVHIALKLFADKTQIPVHVIPEGTSHSEMLEWHSKARISIGVSISDAISTSLLEALVMGSFPIQSCTSCANEWIVHGLTGIIVLPEDIVQIEKAIRNALSNDDMVDKAGDMNWSVGKLRLEREYIKNKAISMYSELLSI